MTEPFGVEAPGYVTIRFLQYAALLVVIGATVFGTAVLSRIRTELPQEVVDAARGKSARIGFVAALALGVTVMLRLVAQSYAMGMESVTADRAMLVTMITATEWGRAWLLEAGAIMVAMVAFIGARRGRRLDWRVAVAACCALAVAMAMSGHAAAMPNRRWLAILADALHVLGAAGWLGSLLILVIVGLPTAGSGDTTGRSRHVATLVTAFSPVALTLPL